MVDYSAGRMVVEKGRLQVDWTGEQMVGRLDSQKECRWVLQMV